jgi:RNA polymerase sigma factor (sigma-70 family)
MNLFDAWPEKISPEIEADLYSKIFGAESEETKAVFRENLVLYSMREGYAYAHHFGRNKFDEGQLVSLAYEALRRAVKNFKPNGGCRFFAYAKPYIRGEVFRAFSAVDIIPRMTRVSLEVCREGHPETGEIDLYHEENPEIGGSETMDFDRMHWAELWAKLEPHLKSLTKKEQSVIADFREGLNFREMGDKRSVSRAAMQSTFARALGKLRKAMGVSHE